jgi:hypothetical protein
MDETMTVPPAPQDQPGESFLSRAIDVFTSPGRAFEAIARKPDFIIPLIVTTVGAIVMTETMLQKIGAERIVRQSLEMSGRADKMTPEQVDKASQTAAPYTAALMHAIGVVGTPIYLLVIAAVGLFIVNVILGGSANFKTTFSVASYAGLVLVVGVVLGLVMVLGADLEQFNPDNFVPTTVGFFLNPRETSKPIYVIASSFDVFRVWFIVLCSIGFSAATGKKVKTLPVLLTFLGIWVIIVLGHAGIAAAMG